MSMKRITAEKARVRLGDIILRAHDGEPTLITYHGLPAAVVISVKAWEQWSTLLLQAMSISSDDHGSATESHSK